MSTSIKLILASSSSRRQALLSRLDLHYNVIVPSISESLYDNECPEIYVQRIAREKAEVVWQRESNQIPVLAADTIIEFHGNIISKPANRKHAQKALHMLTGHEHIVYTAMCLWTKLKVYESMTRSIVRFKNLSRNEIEAYCATDEPYDKAGAYAIQGHAANFIEYISGSYTGIVGLPLAEVQSLLIQANIKN